MLFINGFIVVTLIVGIGMIFWISWNLVELARLVVYSRHKQDVRDWLSTGIVPATIRGRIAAKYYWSHRYELLSVWN